MLISFICGGLGAFILVKYNDSNRVIVTNTGSTIRLNEDNSISESVKKVYDSVVVVEGFSNKQLASTGTGFVYKQTEKKAYVMTNHHVVNGCDSVKLILSNNKEI
jgi:serine protease Do